MMLGNKTYRTLRDVNDGREIPPGSKFFMIDWSEGEDRAVIRVGGFPHTVSLTALKDATI